MHNHFTNHPFASSLVAKNSSNCFAAFFLTAAAGMRSITAEVVFGIFEVVELTAPLAFGPEVGAPEKERRFGRGEVGFSRHLLLNEMPHGEGTFIGIGLWVQTRRGIASEDAAAEIGDAEVREASFEVMQHLDGVGLELREMLSL